MPTRLAEPRTTELGDPGPAVSDLGLDRDAMWTCYREVRRTTEALCAPLEIEDYVIQSMPDASPAKWHLAHTSWFFETFVLASANPGLGPVDPRYPFLFNSYYNAVGERIARDRRGLLSRPTVAEVFHYRAAIDRAHGRLPRTGRRARARPGPEHVHPRAASRAAAPGADPHRHQARPGRQSAPSRLSRADGTSRDEPARSRPPGWCSFPGGRPLDRPCGRRPSRSTTRRPRHQRVRGRLRARRPAGHEPGVPRVHRRRRLRPARALALRRLVRAPPERLDRAPLLGSRPAAAGESSPSTGMRDLDLDEPVCHVSLLRGRRLRPLGRRPAPHRGRVGNRGRRRRRGHRRELPRVGAVPSGAAVERLATLPRARRPSQLFGDVWEWTQSPYTPYRGYRPAAGALGEYNGKFMCNQMVLRGGSCATPRSHIRATYRNFFPPEARWQFSGIRLAATSDRRADHRGVERVGRDRRSRPRQGDQLAGLRVTG